MKLIGEIWSKYKRNSNKEDFLLIFLPLLVA